MDYIWELEGREPELIEVLEGFPQVVEQALYQSLFFPSETYAEPVPGKPNQYQFVTLKGVKGPIDFKFILLMMVKMKWLEVFGDGTKCRVNPDKAQEILDRPYGVGRETLRRHFRRRTGGKGAR